MWFRRWDGVRGRSLPVQRRGCARSPETTIVPGFTRARTRYIHVKAQAPNRGILTTQRYFAGESWNASDAIYSPELLMAIETTAGGRPATSSFVLQS